MNSLKIILILCPFLVFSQVDIIEDDDEVTIEYLIIEGDSVPRKSIDLDEVVLLHKLKFGDKQERIRYLILRRKTIKVYPYAKIAAERLDSMNTHLASLKNNRQKNKYTKKMQKYVEEEFSVELKKLTRTEGQILVKLIDRQTGTTAYDLVKELRSSWRAFWYNTTASMFDISLKTAFDPVNVKEDFLIEDILQRAFQDGLLERQAPAVEFNFYDLANKWIYHNSPD